MRRPFRIPAAALLCGVLAIAAYVVLDRIESAADDHRHWFEGAQAQAQQPAAPPVREISKIAGEVYRFRNNNHYNVFAVTPEGIIATDPIDADAAAWLKNEFKTRFNKPVRYVIYSHDHRDHIAGGQVFADTAIVVAHERAKEAILGEKRPTAVPNVTFKDKLDIELGGTKVELRYVGRNHSDNSIVMRFPKERILFAVDFIPVESMAFRDFPDAYMPEWIDSLKQVEAMDFDILAPGHGKLAKHDAVRAFRGYMEDLYAQVQKLAREGKTVEDAKQMVNLSKYQNWNNYKEYGPLNIEGVYRLVQGSRRPN